MTAGSPWRIVRYGITAPSKREPGLHPQRQVCSSEAGACAHSAFSAEFGIEPRVLVTRRGDDVSAMAAGALAEGHRPIVAGGGVGTVNAVVGNLVRYACPADHEKR